MKRLNQQDIASFSERTVIRARVTVSLLDSDGAGNQIQGLASPT